MCIFKYREKKFGKLSLIIFSLLAILLGAAAIFGGVMAVIKLDSWAKYLLVVLGSIFGLIFLVVGIVALIITFSMTGRNKSVRDINSGKGLSGTRLCEFCGRVVSKDAEVCEHCGKKLHEGLGIKKCPECKAKNSAKAEFCEQCGHKFED